MLLARCALPRFVQTACAGAGAVRRRARQDLAAADLSADQLAVRPLHRRVRGLRGPRRAGAGADLSPDLGQRAWREHARLQRALEGVLLAQHHHRRRGLAVRAGAAEPTGRRGRDPAPDHAADPGDRRAQAHRRRAPARQGNRRIRQPRQEPLRGGPEPRAALAAECDQRLCPTPGAGHDAQHQAARPGPRRPPQRRPPLRPDRRHSGHFQDRGGAAVPVARRGALDRIPRPARRHVPPSSRAPRASTSCSGGRRHCRSWSMPTRSGCARC